MRIPVPIVISSCVVATILTWYFSTRHADFTTPPTKSELKKTAVNWKKSNASDSKSDDDQKSSPSTETSKATPPNKATPTPPPPPQIPIGDIHRSPRLSEYGEFGDQGADAMIALALKLESKQAPKRALLAWERVIDSTEANKAQVKQASQAIAKLKPTASPWNPDPSTELTITLHAGATISNKKALQEALQATAAVITEASGFILHVKTEMTLGKGAAPKTPRTPIAIWFTHSLQKPKKNIVKTPPLSFMADPTQEEMLANQFQAAAYALISNHMAETTDYAKFPEYPAGVTPEELLKFYVTRLMWSEFVKSLQ